jgi:hypothetical protein
MKRLVFVFLCYLSMTSVFVKCFIRPGPLGRMSFVSFARRKAPGIVLRCVSCFGIFCYYVEPEVLIENTLKKIDINVDQVRNEVNAIRKILKVEDFGVKQTSHLSSFLIVSF